MKQVTTEIKSQIFGLYYGQPIHRCSWWTDSTTVTNLMGHVHRGHECDPRLVKDSYLEVTPLSNLTDEHAVEVVRMAFGRREFKRQTVITKTCKREVGFSFMH